jgi:FO synthase
VELGPAGAAACLQAGANDLGGTLMNESISRAAGNEHGEELPPERMESLAAGVGRKAEQRNTLYGTVDPERRRLSYSAAPLTAVVQTPAWRRASARVA